MELAYALSFDDVEAGNVGLVVTEAARNLLKHAGGGDLLLRAVGLNHSAAVEVLALDNGPGIANIGRSFDDGYSTAGTPGNGLGAISRIASFHDIYSQPQHGTALLALVSRRRRPGSEQWTIPGRYRIGAVSVPITGEPVCGDAWSFSELPEGRGARLIVADGLGHGPLAAEAARAAIRIHEENRDEGGVELMQSIHNALRPTRGAAVAFAEIPANQGIVRYTGIGNIGGSIVGPAGRVQHMVSHAGTAGHEMRKVVSFEYPWDPGNLLVMHSDGLLSRWSLERYPGLAQRHPSLVAGILYRDYNRGRDDVTVAVLQAVKGTA